MQIDRLAALLLTVSVAACAGEGADAADTSRTRAATATSAVSRESAEVLAPVTEYRITQDKVDRYFAVHDKFMDRMAAMSPAEREALKAKEAEEDDDDSSDGPQTVEEMAKEFEKLPPYAAAIREAGLSTKEYATLTLALMQAGMAAAIQKMRPNDNADSLAREMKANPENVRFMREHGAEIERRTKAMQARMKQFEPDGG